MSLYFNVSHGHLAPTSVQTLKYKAASHIPNNRQYRPKLVWHIGARTITGSMNSGTSTVPNFLTVAGNTNVTSIGYCAASKRSSADSFCWTTIIPNSGGESRNNLFMYRNEAEVSIRKSAHFTSIDSTGTYSLNFNTVDTAPNYMWTTMTLGGSDIRGVSQKEFFVPTSTGAQQYNFDVGADLYIFVGGAHLGTGQYITHANEVIGYATPDSSGFVHGFLEESGLPSTVAKRWQWSNRCYVNYDLTSQFINAEGYFLEKNNSGFVINWLTVPSIAQRFFVTGIKGGQYNLTKFSTGSSVGNYTVSGIPFTPIGMFFSSDMRPIGTSGDIRNHCYYLQGAFDGKKQYGYNSVYQNSISTTNTRMYCDIDNMFHFRDITSIQKVIGSGVEFGTGIFKFNISTAVWTDREILTVFIGSGIKDVGNTNRGVISHPMSNINSLPKKGATIFRR